MHCVLCCVDCIWREILWRFTTTRHPGFQMSVCKLLLQLVFGENHRGQTRASSEVVRFYWESAVVWFSGSDVINCPGSRRLVCEAWGWFQELFSSWIKSITSKHVISRSKSYFTFSEVRKVLSTICLIRNADFCPWSTSTSNLTAGNSQRDFYLNSALTKIIIIVIVI